jgi:hypothetical protein
MYLLPLVPRRSQLAPPSQQQTHNTPLDHHPISPSGFINTCDMYYFDDDASTTITSTAEAFSVKICATKVTQDTTKVAQEERYYSMMLLTIMTMMDNATQTMTRMAMDNKQCCRQRCRQW